MYCFKDMHYSIMRVANGMQTALTGWNECKVASMSTTCTHYIHKPVALPFTTVLLVLFVYTTRNTLQCMLCIHLVIWLKIVQQQLQSGSTVFCQLNRMIYYFNIKCIAFFKNKTKKKFFCSFLLRTFEDRLFLK